MSPLEPATRSQRCPTLHSSSVHTPPPGPQTGWSAHCFGCCVFQVRAGGRDCWGLGHQGTPSPRTSDVCVLHCVS